MIISIMYPTYVVVKKLRTLLLLFLGFVFAAAQVFYISLMIIHVFASSIQI